jgi:hypothetical protein
MVGENSRELTALGNLMQWRTIGDRIRPNFQEKSEVSDFFLLDDMK